MYLHLLARKMLGEATFFFFFLLFNVSSFSPTSRLKVKTCEEQILSGAFLISLLYFKETVKSNKHFTQMCISEIVLHVFS